MDISQISKAQRLTTDNQVSAEARHIIKFLLSEREELISMLQTQQNTVTYNLAKVQGWKIV